MTVKQLQDQLGLAGGGVASARAQAPAASSNVRTAEVQNRYTLVSPAVKGVMVVPLCPTC